MGDHCAQTAGGNGLRYGEGGPQVGSDRELGREPGSRGGEVWRWGQVEEEQG